MENYSSMNDIQQNNYTEQFSSYAQTANKNSQLEQYELKAHESDSMKVKPPNVSHNELPALIPQKVVYSDYEANKKLERINNEIFKEANGGMDISQFRLKPLNEDIFVQKTSENKENKKHGFNLKRYFTIFGIIALLTTAISYFCRRKG